MSGYRERRQCLNIYAGARRKDETRTAKAEYCANRSSSLVRSFAWFWQTLSLCSISTPTTETRHHEPQ